MKAGLGTAGAEVSVEEASTGGGDESEELEAAVVSDALDFLARDRTIFSPSRLRPSSTEIDGPKELPPLVWLIDSASSFAFSI